MWACIILAKDSSRDALKEGYDFGLRSRRWFAVRGILYKGTLARNSRCSRCRRTDEVDISPPVAEDHGAANCLDEAIRSFTAEQVVDRRALTPPSVVHCLFFELFSARRSTASKLASLWNSSAAQAPIAR
ncbi:uncharacterized protein TNCV_5058971 [Trichonephila clavipes]|nr:uncharacterized protein TNCV_5058971 [Trichonephila clavipes]